MKVSKQQQQQHFHTRASLLRATVDLKLCRRPLTCVCVCACGCDWVHFHCIFCRGWPCGLWWFLRANGAADAGWDGSYGRAEGAPLRLQTGERSPAGGLGGWGGGEKKKSNFKAVKAAVLVLWKHFEVPNKIYSFKRAKKGLGSPLQTSRRGQRELGPNEKNLEEILTDQGEHSQWCSFYTAFSRPHPILCPFVCPSVVSNTEEAHWLAGNWVPLLELITGTCKHMRHWLACLAGFLSDKTKQTGPFWAQLQRSHQPPHLDAARRASPHHCRRDNTINVLQIIITRKACYMTASMLMMLSPLPAPIELTRLIEQLWLGGELCIRFLWVDRIEKWVYFEISHIMPASALKLFRSHKVNCVSYIRSH